MPGGSANDYDYCNADPINCTDLDGRWPHFHVKKWLHKVATVANVTSNLLAWCPLAQCQGASLALGAVAAGAYALSGDGDSLCVRLM